MKEILWNLSILSQIRTTDSLNWFCFDWKLVDMYWEIVDFYLFKFRAKGCKGV